MALKALSCPDCGHEITGETGFGVVLECPNNHYVGVSRDTHDVYAVPTQLVKPSRLDPKKGRLIFLPFWGFNVFINVRDRKIQGGGLWRMLSGQKLLSGDCTMYVCAAELPDDDIDELSRHYSLNNPPGSSNLEDSYREDFEKLPVFIDEGTAFQHAEFIFLKNEFDASGTLQWIDYDFEFREFGLVYLPFYMDNKRKNTYYQIV